MIDYERQTELFQDIAEAVQQDVICYAFGGTAMLYYGYKEQTKDVDLIFTDVDGRKTFIQALAELDFEPTGPRGVFAKRKAVDPGAPVMYTDGGARFDLFVERIFRTKLTPSMQGRLFATHEYPGTHTLTVRVVAKETIVLLKAVTDRLRDFDDIILLAQDTEPDWEAITQEAILQHEQGDDWILLDLEEKMQRLRKYADIPERHFTRLYEAQP